jgi:hypothetical protein
VPSFKAPTGKNVKSLVFVSGSKEGGYGAFHFPSSQTDYDRIVVDSLNVSGVYSPGAIGSPLPVATASALNLPHLFRPYQLSECVLSVIDPEAPALQAATHEDFANALLKTSQSRLALAKYIESKSPSAAPIAISKQSQLSNANKLDRLEVGRRLVLDSQQVLSLVHVAATILGGRKYLSTALVCAELVESFQLLAGKGDPGRTDGEAVSRVLAFKLAPEIALVPGFNSWVTQKWWLDGHPDWVNDNSQDDQSFDANGAGVMFLEFLNDYLGVSIEAILAHMPETGGAPLGQTYLALLNVRPDLAQVAGNDGMSAFRTMVSLLTQNTNNANGTLNLPANGNPFPGMPNSKQGGLFGT